MQNFRGKSNNYKSNNTWSTIPYEKKPSKKKSKKKINTPSWVVPELATIALSSVLTSVTPDNIINKSIKLKDALFTTIKIPSQVSNISHGAWEYIYFNHILDLLNIFSSYSKKLKLNIDTNSFRVINSFSRFIYKCSSGKISPYIENFNTSIDNIYKEYTI